MSFQPIIEIQEILLGNQVGGVASNGTVAATALNPGSPYYRGKIKIYEDGTAGGLFSPVSGNGATLKTVMFDGAGSSHFHGFLVDPSGFEYQMFEYSGAPSASVLYQPGDPVLVPPGWSVKFTNGANLTAKGRVAVEWGAGWLTGYFEDVTFVP